MVPVRLIVLTGVISSARLAALGEGQVAAHVDVEMVEEECTAVAGEEGQCDDSLSLRQLRGELRTAAQDQFEDDGGAHLHTANVDEICGVASGYCGDIQVYLLRKDCASDRLCRTLDAADVYPNLARGELWYCAPADRKCDRKPDLEEFQSVDEVPQEYWPQPHSFLEKPHGTCEGRPCGRYDPAKPCQCNDKCRDYGNCCSDFEAVCASCVPSRCGMYDPGAKCQCNKHCTSFHNCCSNYEGVCGAKVNTSAGTCVGRSCYDAVLGAMCQCNTKCRERGDCCHDYQKVCVDDHRSSSGVGGEIKTLYHTTSKEVAKLIAASNFRPGRGGWCGGAIYFIDHPHLPLSKYAPGITQGGAILEAKVEMGKMATRVNNKCQGYGGHGVAAAEAAGYDSLRFDPGDGPEYIVWKPEQIVAVRIYEFKE